MFHEARRVRFQPLCLIGHPSLPSHQTGVIAKCGAATLLGSVIGIRLVVRRDNVSHVTHEVHDLVVAETDSYGPATLGGFGLKCNHKIENGATPGTTINEISKLN